MLFRVLRVEKGPGKGGGDPRAPEGAGGVLTASEREATGLRRGPSRHKAARGWAPAGPLDKCSKSVLQTLIEALV